MSLNSQRRTKIVHFYYCTCCDKKIEYKYSFGEDSRICKTCSETGSISDEEESGLAGWITDIIKSEEAEKFRNEIAGEIKTLELEKLRLEKIRIEKLEEGILPICKICLSEEATIVSHSCGHFILCESCQPMFMENQEKCPMCRSWIVGYLKTFK